MIIIDTIINITYEKTLFSVVVLLGTVVNYS